MLASPSSVSTLQLWSHLQRRPLRLCLVRSIFVSSAAGSEKFVLQKSRETISCREPSFSFQSPLSQQRRHKTGITPGTTTTTQENHIHEKEMEQEPTVDMPRNDKRLRFDSVANMNPSTKKAILKLGFAEMTPIQHETWQAAIQNQEEAKSDDEQAEAEKSSTSTKQQYQDVIGLAQTGTGKTLAFALVALERILRESQQNEEGAEAQTFGDSVQAILIAPTRELAQQIGDQVEQLIRQVQREDKKRSRNHARISCGTVYGGRVKSRDFAAVKKMSGGDVPTILVGTPGRILDHIESSTVIGLSREKKPFRDCFSQLKVLVLDEFDRLLDMGFQKDVAKIVSHLPHKGRQTLVYSATLSANVQSKVFGFVQHDNHAVLDCVGGLWRENEFGENEIALGNKKQPPKVRVPPNIEQTYVVLPRQNWVWKTVAILLQLMDGGGYSQKDCNSDKTKNHPRKVLVFFSTRAQVSFFAQLFNLELGRRVLEIHSDLSAHQRAFVSHCFRHASSGGGADDAVVLFSSDLSARGMDYHNITHVVQVGAPPDQAMYVHRLGRTGRAEKRGQGILVLNDLEAPWVLEKDLKGLELHQHKEFFKLATHSRLEPAFLEESKMRIAANLRSSAGDDLKAKARAMYFSLLGFGLSKFKEYRSSARQQEELVDSLNHVLVHQVGVLHLPTLSTREVKQYGLGPFLETTALSGPRRIWHVGAQMFQVGDKSHHDSK